MYDTTIGGSKYIMSTTKVNDKQIASFHHQIVELIKKYQFRDRNQTVCCGVSVSQCYLLETLHTHGALTVNEVAKKMFLSISTITRVVDQLVKKELVSRREGVEDRRVRLLELTEKGHAVYEQSWKMVFQSEKKILEHFPLEQRDLLIDFLKKLNNAVDDWQACCKQE